MKKLLALFLSCLMLMTGCSVKDSSGIDETNNVVSEITEATEKNDVVSDDNYNESQTQETIVSESTTATEIESEYQTEPPLDVTQNFTDEEYVESLNFLALNDPDLLQYVEDSVYTELVEQLHSDDYIVENVEAVYMPTEYFEEVEFNSQENIYFGYTASELDEIFQGTKYVFTLDENGQTTVEEMKVINDDTYTQVIKDVAIGTGVILICVTVSIVSDGIGVPAVSTVFAASAKTATTFAVSSSALGGVSAAVIKGIETRNVEEVIKASAAGAAEGFKWGAISGAVVGGASKSYKLFKSGKDLTNALAEGSPIEIGRAGEAYAKEFYNGEAEVSFLAGKEVPKFTPGATRPDYVIKKAGNAVEAIEVKNYDLENNLSGLKNELKRQVGDRVKNLPTGSSQRISLITKGRGYSKEFIDQIVEELQTYLFDTYGGEIPIDIL